MHLCRDGRGRPLGFVLSAGQEHETQWSEPLMETVLAGGEVPNGSALVGDKRYSSGMIRAWCEAHGLVAVIPRFRTQPVDDALDRQRYRTRNVIEWLIGRLKPFSRIATRYEKHSDIYLAILTLVAIWC
ncbi:MAG: transposase [Armatimonadetes bacterium]|nr:transposase [Armatimonadota bacterium]